MNSLSKSLVFDLDIENENHVEFSSSIKSALDGANNEILEINETIDSINSLKPECDKIDYALAASSGALCGLIDIFLVGKPGESPLGNITDKWFEERVKDFSKLCGRKVENEDSLSAAIEYLEKKFVIPYDQTTIGLAGSDTFDINTFNHHFHSLAHNPTILGLFFSILDQFKNRSDFVVDGELITLWVQDSTFELKGNNLVSKLFCGFVNWIGHIMSDVSGSHTSKGRGTGIPSPFWAWTNDVIALKNSIGIQANKFDKSINELAADIFKEGFDVRFQTAQAIPVFINECLVRLFYSIRRMIKYLKDTPKTEQSFKLLWNSCEPFKNPTVKRMLTVAHGTFCLIDTADATIRGFATGAGTFNITEFALRLNIVGLGRFTISLYGELKREIVNKSNQKEINYLNKKKIIVEDYIAGLNVLAQIYDDRNLVNFVDDFKRSDLYVDAFKKTIELADKRDVPKDDVLRNKEDIDNYFCGGKN